jgi:hypothetical protein
MNLQRFRKSQNIFSTIIFLGVFSFFASTTKFKLTDIQLSYWGVNNQFSWVWNISIAILSISFYYNYKSYLTSNSRLSLPILIKILFLSTFVCLFLTGIIDMRFAVHNLFAFTYFFAYPLAIFLLAHFNSKNLPYSEWLIHLSFSILITVIPLSIIPLHKGFAYPEMSHSVLIMLWNVWILTKTY